MHLAWSQGRQQEESKKKNLSKQTNHPSQGMYNTCPSPESLPSSKCSLGVKVSWERQPHWLPSARGSPTLLFYKFLPFFFSCTELKCPAFAGKHRASHATLPSPRVAALPPALSSQQLEMPQLLFFHPKSTDKVPGLCNELGDLGQAPCDENPTGIHSRGDGNDPKAALTGRRLPGHTILVQIWSLL